MVYLNPKIIIADFLRVYLDDPRERNTETNTETITVDQYIHTDLLTIPLTPPSGSVSCVTSVTVNSTSKTKWTDYYPDFEDEEIIFFSALSDGDSVAVTYKYGSTDWIYPDKPEKTLNSESFPRINILTVTGSGQRLGEYAASVESTIHLQIDIWCKEKIVGNIFTIDGKKYAGKSLAEYLAFQITKAFEDHEDALHPALYSYVPVQIPRDLPFDTVYQAHHKIVEVLLKGINIGRIS